MENKVGITHKNEVKLLPVQILFSKFISFPAHSLIEFLKKESQENPFLNFEFNEELLNNISYSPSGREKLKEQLIFLKIPENIQKIAEFIIDNLEDNGYFKMKLNQVCEILKVDYKDVENALKVVQQLEPKGVGARDLKECLLIQAKSMYSDSLLVEIIQNHWELVVKRKFDEIAKKMKIEREKVEKEILKLKKLNPHPLESSFDTNIKRIIPEGRVEKEGEKLNVYIEDKIAPFLIFNSDYERYINSPLISLKEKKFLEKKLKKARLIMKMLDERKKILKEIFEEIVNYQKEFFENGTLFPLREKDIAERKNLSIATISRAINGKYLISPKGLIKIKDLFTPEFKGSISKAFVMEKIKEIIENEERPLSDREISEKLGYFGIKISTRTVNKYRNQMGFLNLYLRNRE